MLEDSIEKLVKDGLISDERFAESYFQSRKNRGFGPLRIKNELKQKGVNESLFDEIQEGTDWPGLALNVLQKKVKGKFPEEQKDIMKLKNFLNYRGFNFQDIEKAFSMIEIE
jgi:regulatory protein